MHLGGLTRDGLKCRVGGIVVVVGNPPPEIRPSSEADEQQLTNPFSYTFPENSYRLARGREGGSWTTPHRVFTTERPVSFAPERTTPSVQPVGFPTGNHHQSLQLGSRANFVFPSFSVQNPIISSAQSLLNQTTHPNHSEGNST